MVHPAEARWKAVELWMDHGWDVQRICTATGLSERTWRREKQCFIRHGDVWGPGHYQSAPPHNRMPQEHVDILLGALDVQPRLKLKQLAAILQNVTRSERRYSISTICRALQRADITGLKQVRGGSCLMH
jgi:hypothetical protein